MDIGAMNRNELKDFLDQKALQYNHPQFIASDPIQDPSICRVGDTYEKKFTMKYTTGSSSPF